MGVIQSYHFTQLEPFLASLRQSGYKGDIVFFHQGIDLETLKAIRRFQVRLIPFHNARGAAHGITREWLDFVSIWFHRAKWPRYEKTWHFLLSTVRLRHRLYHRFLRGEGKAYGRVLLTDTRDVFFQADPFQDAPKEDLVFFEESHPLNHGKINATWIRAQLGEAALDRLGGSMTLCSGTTMGTPAALRCYLERIMETMRRAGSQHMVQGDQGIHNAVVYEGLRGIQHSVRLCPNGDGPVYTLTQYLNSCDIRMSGEGDVLNASGKIVPVIHQYDRHPKIMAALLGKIRKPFRADLPEEIK